MKEGGVSNSSVKGNIHLRTSRQEAPTARGPPFRHPGRQSRGEIFNGQPYDSHAKSAHRTSICPFLLRVFVKIGDGSKEGSDPGQEQQLPPNARAAGNEEFQVYAWMNDSLREVVNLVKDIVVEARDPRAKLKLQRRCHETDTLTDMGVVNSTYHNANDRRTLRSFSFEIGDTIDLTIEQHTKKSNTLQNGSDHQSVCKDDHETVEMDGDDEERSLPPEEKLALPIHGSADSSAINNHSEPSSQADAVVQTSPPLASEPVVGSESTTAVELSATAMVAQKEQEKAGR